MSDIQDSLQPPGLLPAVHSAPPASSVRLFSRRIKIVWFLVTILVCTAELMPVAPMPIPLYVLYYGLKVACFFGIGFLSPLAYYRLNGIGLGLIFSFSSAFLIEAFQGMLHNGHSFHSHELAGKLALIAVGFAIALDRRYERKISLGQIQIRLKTDTPADPRINP